MDESGLVEYGSMWFVFGLVWLIFSDLNENAIVDTWMEDNLFLYTLREDDLDEKIIKNNGSGSAIQLSLRTCISSR